MQCILLYDADKQTVAESWLHELFNPTLHIHAGLANVKSVLPQIQQLPTK